MQTGMYSCKPNPTLPPSNPFFSFYLTLVLFFPFTPPRSNLGSSSFLFVYFRSPPSPWMVFLMRRSIVVNHWSRRDIESNSLTASVNASLFCSSWASRSFCCNDTGTKSDFIRSSCYNEQIIQFGDALDSRGTLTFCLLCCCTRLSGKCWIHLLTFIPQYKASLT